MTLRPSTPRGRRRLLAAAVVFWGAYGLWLLLVADLQPPELLAGLVAAGMAAVAGDLACTGQLRARVRAADLRGLWWLPLDAARDTAVVLAAALLHATGLRRLRSGFTTLPFPGGDTALGRGRRALATARMSFAPNTVVLGFDVEEGTVTVHRLVPSRKRAPVPQEPGR